ncbi:TRAP transporter solute receptor, TAXI family [uncultured Alphaproteobacteria bacterium]|uniref:TRAP transporter solute receptor, TAXI family n=1 Tax=uncultured Alphaproteobacteria bacterium TaxID=91750 RepID=A0A212KM68_9PROT|nr:TRAP transporter solute receptor, TAXI family [uncultured Alphaproteobacteria bacterium]
MAKSLRQSAVRTLTLGLAAAASLSLAPKPASAEQFINVVTGGTSGVYYPLGVALTKLYVDAIPGVRTSVQATKASAENLNLLQRERAELAFTLGDALADAWNGNEEAGFPQKLDKLRGVAAIYSNYVHFVARADSGIKSLKDLKGKRVSVGAPKSGTELNARALLTANGIKYSDFSKVEYLPYAESAQLIQNNQIDGTLLSSGLGVAAIRELAASTPVVIVPITPEEIAKIGQAVYQPGKIPAGTYTGQTEDVPTVTINNYLVTHKDVPEDVVYRMTKSMYEHLDALVAAHSAAKAIDPKKALAGMPLPVHPGAAKYYKEVGLTK